MECTIVHGPVAEAGSGDVVGLLDLECVSAATRVQNARSYNAAGPHHPDFGLEEMHASATSLRTAGFTAIQFSNQLFRMQSFRKGVPVSAMRAEDNVLFAKMSKHASCDRFFTDIRVARSVHQALLMRLGQTFFALTNDLHRTIERKQGV